MPLIALRDVELGFGGPALLDRVTFQIDPGERVCLVGPNGTGKSTLLGVVAGRIAPDAGVIERDPGLRLAELPQSVPPGVAGSVREVVASGLDDLRTLIDEHHRLAERAGAGGSLAALEAVQRRIEAAGGWDVDARVTRTLTSLDLDGDADFSARSGGQQRRVLLARALVGDPQLLLLDEPTNHLDIEAIEWLEAMVGAWRGAVLFTTHDRRFLERTATRILELDRGALTSWPGDWANYLRRRDERLAAEDLENARFDRRLAEEEVWIRQGIKARRTRNEGRVRRLEAMRRERAERRQQVGRARFAVSAAEASGKRVVETRGVSFGWGEAAVVRDLSLTIGRGDRVGIVGPNGSGKTTLLRLLLGDLAPQTGEVELGTRLEIAYFDQHRARLDDAATVRDSVADGADQVAPDGKPRHVLSYLQDFLFPPQRARSPVGSLSGGERARLLLARLFAMPSNVLVMDEPTNDLDIETLELLEERLMEYPGTLLLVSHDRAFLDNVVTTVLLMEGDGRVGEYVGGYSDAMRQRAASVPAATPRREPSPAAPPAPPQRRKGLSYSLKRELEALPARIEALETAVAEHQARLADPSMYRADGEAIATAREALAAAETELAAAYDRWAELEAMAEA